MARSESLARRALELDPGLLGVRFLLSLLCEVRREYYDEDCSAQEQRRLEIEECEVRGDTARGWACRHHFIASTPEEETEALEIRKLPLEAALQLVRDGEITDAISVAALYRGAELTRPSAP